MYCTRLTVNTGRQKSPSRHHRTILSGCIFATKARIDSRKNLLNSSTSSTCRHNMVNFGPLTAGICWRVWGIPANFNRFRVLAALPHGTLVVGVSQTLRRWIEGATYIWQGGHHVRHSSIYLFSSSSTITIMTSIWHAKLGGSRKHYYMGCRYPHRKEHFWIEKHCKGWNFGDWTKGWALQKRVDQS